MDYILKLPYSSAVIDKLNQLLELLESGISMEKVVLFGSYARAEYRVDSDIDILVLTKDLEDRCTRGELCSAFESLGADLVFYKSSDFKSSQCLFVKQVKEEGVLLWKS